MSENIYRPMRPGKHTEVWTAFVAECSTGRSALFHHPSYVCMNREYFDETNKELLALREENGRLVAAILATDKYFKALRNSWSKNKGRVVSKSGVVIEGNDDIERLCDIAGRLIGEEALRSSEVKG